MISIQNISFSVKGKTLVKNVSLSIAAGEFIVVMGANGAGKSTLLKMIAGSLQPISGKIIFKGKELKQYPANDLAKQRAVLSQHYHIGFPMLAREIVMMGRYPYFNTQPAATDEDIVQKAMAKMQVTAFADRDYTTLSGGEAQKIQMCRVLAQIGETSAEENKLLLLDEPVSHLDVKYQQQLLQEAKLLCKKNVAVCAVLHDINLALQYADKIVFLKEGSVIQVLSREAQITAELLKEVFDANAAIFDMPGYNRKFVSFNT